MNIRLLCKKSYGCQLALLFAPLIFLLLTQNFVPFGEPLYGFSDQNTYINIATCSSFDDFGLLGEYMPAHHLERGFFNYLVGLISFHLNYEIYYVYLSFVLFVAIVSIFTIFSIDVSFPFRFLISCVIILNPYSFRMYFFAPAMIADAMFFFNYFVFFQHSPW